MFTRFRQGEVAADDHPNLDSVFVGRSPAFQRVAAIAQRVAALNTTVMILGETGSGKETIARLIHSKSRRADRPFIPVDCTALPESLFESELFGHVKGSFTGAHRDSLGYVRSAHGGTLFLDEIGELSQGLQAKLLRVLQDRRVVPVGASSAVVVDFRVICATNRDLRAMVTAGTFREDLYFRLAVISIQLPPLRERHEDIIPLAKHCLEGIARTYGENPRKLSPAVEEALKRHSWPGNIRELHNVIEYAQVLSEGTTIEHHDLPPPLNSGISKSKSVSPYNLDSLERRTIIEALEYCKFNRTAACRLLGIELRRLNRRMESLGIDLPAKIARRPMVKQLAAWGVSGAE